MQIDLWVTKINLIFTDGLHFKYQKLHKGSICCCYYEKENNYNAEFVHQENKVN